METLTDFINELREQLPLPQIPQQKPLPERSPDTLYNIHKRSIPIGIDKVIVIGVSEDEADLELIRLIKREKTRQEKEGIENGVFYFDILPMQATPEELSIYHNEKRLVI